MLRSRLIRSLDLVQLAETLGHLAQAESGESLRVRIDGLADAALANGTTGFLDGFAGRIRDLDCEGDKARLAAVLSRSARRLGRVELANKLRVRSFNYADRLTDEAERATHLLAVVDILAGSEEGEVIRDAVVQARSLARQLEDPDRRMALSLAVAQALARIGEPEEAADELQSLLGAGAETETETETDTEPDSDSDSESESVSVSEPDPDSEPEPEAAPEAETPLARAPAPVAAAAPSGVFSPVVDEAPDPGKDGFVDPTKGILFPSTRRRR